MGHRQDDHQMETLNKYLFFFFLRKKQLFAVPALTAGVSDRLLQRGCLSQGQREEALAASAWGRD